jgi:uncharacterized protein YndB with AHSA1/START domain
VRFPDVTASATLDPYSRPPPCYRPAVTSRPARLVVWLVVCLGPLGIVFAVSDLVHLNQVAAVLVGVAAMFLLSLVAGETSFVRTTLVGERTVAFDVPRSRLYAAMLDFELHARIATMPGRWTRETLAGRPGEVGYRWRVRPANGPFTDHEIVESEPPARLVTRSWSGSRSNSREDEWVLTDTRAGTEVRIRTVMSCSLMGRLMMWVTRRSRMRAVRLADDRLRAVLGAEAANTFST